MSYILEALKRAERERAHAQNPVAGDGTPPSQPPTGNRNTLLKVIIAALAVNAVVIAVLALRHKPTAPVAATDSVAGTQQLAARPGIITAPAPKPPPADEPAEEAPAVQEGVSSMDDLGASDADAEQPAESQPIARTPAVAAVQKHGTVTFSRQPLTNDVPPQEESATEESLSAPESVSDEQAGAVEATPVDEPSAPAVASAQSAPRPSPPAAAISRPVPPSTATASSSSGMVKPLSEMSAAYQGAFPQMSLQVHVYDAAPQKRFAIIDGNRYHEGDSLPQGARITQIVAGGLVIDFRGERVLYPIGRH